MHAMIPPRRKGRRLSGNSWVIHGAKFRVQQVQVQQHGDHCVLAGDVHRIDAFTLQAAGNQPIEGSGLLNVRNMKLWHDPTSLSLLGARAFMSAVPEVRHRARFR